MVRDQDAAAKQAAATPPPQSYLAPPATASTQPSKTPGSFAPASDVKAPESELPPDPIRERGESLWEEFKTEKGEGRIAVYLKTLEDAEVMDDEMAFEMLNVIHEDAVDIGTRTRFAECVGALRERLPEVYDEGAHYYLSWMLRDALAEDRVEAVPPMARQLAERSGRHIDVVERTLDVLGFHGQLQVLVEALRIGWPHVKSSTDIVPWGISEFADKGARHEIFDYLEQTASPDPADAVLLDRVRFFVPEPRVEYLSELIGDLSGQLGVEWKVEDFVLRPHRKRSRDDWDDEEEKEERPDQGADNLSRLMSQFVGYLRREEGVPFPRGDLVRHELLRYFGRRNAGELNPRPSMLEQAMHPNRRLPKPPRPIHPLCPERVTLDVYLGGLMGFMNALYHRAAALFLALPAWLRFLDARNLIDAGTHKKVLDDLRPLHATLLRIWEQYEDPHLQREGRAWPDK